MSSGPEARTKPPSGGSSDSCSRPRHACSASCSMMPRPRRVPAPTPTTIRTAISESNPALPAGLRLVPGAGSRRGPWLTVCALVGAGLVLGAVLTGAPADVVLGTIAALLAIGAALYRPALGLAVLAFTYPYDLTTYAGPVKLTTSYVLLVILVLVWVVREVLPNPPAWRRTPLDWPVLLFWIATVVSILGLTGNYTDQLIALMKAGGGFVLFFLVTQG